MKYSFLAFIVGLPFLFGCKNDEPTPGPKNFTLKGIQIDNQPSTLNSSGVSITPQITLTFSERIIHTSVSAISLATPTANLPLMATFSNNDSTVSFTPQTPLSYLTSYSLEIPASLTSINNKQIGSSTLIKFRTQFDPADKKPQITDAELLTLVQQQTFKYFYDFAYPNSGMAKERNSSGSTVTTGGSGFGIMALIVGIERNFITRQEGLDRIDKILKFLENCDRFHGAWPHWLNGDTGKVIPFSANDNGGDLVETSFLVEGLITFRQYLNPAIAGEKLLIDRINALWQSVEWSWYTQNQNVLYWHWSPDKQWIMNHQIKGYNEALITYFLAAASPTFPITALTYHQGWAGNGSIKNGKKFFEITLPLGFDYGGPLFFTHYSFLGLDPRNLSDTYANYWTQNVNHTLINYAHCVANPNKYYGYSADNWGLTASDNPTGYSAHSPTNDQGVVTPTAALSSIPYAPEQSIRAMRFFYYKLGDKLWGPYGFYDAFDLGDGWFADSYLAIDQGPIVIMIENYRTGLLWNLFMSAPEVKTAMDKLGFQR